MTEEKTREPTQTEPTDIAGPSSRRRVLTGIGAAAFALGGSSAVASASGNGDESERGRTNGRTPLDDLAVDLLVYWSSGDAPDDFNYPIAPPEPDRGLFFAGHDPEDGGLLDYSRFELTAGDNTLHNEFVLFQGAIMASKPKPYTLTRRGDGVFESRGQVLNFEVLPYEETAFAGMGIDREELPPIDILAGESWRAVGTDIAKLETDEDGAPLPVGEWGVTRVDVYSHGQGKPEYELSLLYQIWGAEDPTRLEPEPGELLEDVPDDVDEAAREMIDTGRLNLGGQPRGGGR